MKKILIGIGVVLIIIILAGIYKFNYLANQPGYDVDGNKIENPAKKNDLVQINPNHLKKVGKDGKYELETTIPQSALKLTSPDFQNGEEIPAKFTCDGEKAFPTLQISGIPAKTKSLLLIVSEPQQNEMPKKVHGTFWGIPADTTEINNENFAGFSQGANDFPKTYSAPCPSEGTSENYLFELWALDKEIKGTPDWTAGHLLVNSLGHILGKSVLKTHYER